MIIAIMLLAVLFAVVGYIVGYCCGREDRSLNELRQRIEKQIMDDCDR